MNSIVINWQFSQKCEQEIPRSSALKANYVMIFARSKSAPVSIIAITHIVSHCHALCLMTLHRSYYNGTRWHHYVIGYNTIDDVKHHQTSVNNMCARNKMFDKCNRVANLTPLAMKPLVCPLLIGSYPGFMALGTHRSGVINTTV